MAWSAGSVNSNVTDVDSPALNSESLPVPTSAYPLVVGDEQTVAPAWLKSRAVVDGRSTTSDNGPLMSALPIFVRVRRCTYRPVARFHWNALRWTLS